MTTLEIILSLGMVFSTTATVVMVWYVRILMKKYAEVLSFWNSSFEKIGDFAEHVEKVYEMDRFTGEPTLEGLMSHSMNLLSDLSDIPNLVNDFSSEGIEQQEEERQVG